MKYRKPRTLNSVTFLLLAGLGVLIYLAICLWPVYSARARAKGILWDHIPALYRANLRSNDVGLAMFDDIKSSITAELGKAGVNAKGAKISLFRDAKEIAIEVRFTVKAHFPFPDKTYEFELAPKVVSDATRVDW